MCFFFNFFHNRQRVDAGYIGLRWFRVIYRQKNTRLAEWQTFLLLSRQDRRLTMGPVVTWFWARTPVFMPRQDWQPVQRPVVTKVQCGCLPNQCHRPGNQCIKGRMNNDCCNPLPDNCTFGDIRLQVLCTGDFPSLGFSHPVPVNEDTVEDTHYQSDNCHLPKTIPESCGSIDAIYHVWN